MKLLFLLSALLAVTSAYDVFYLHGKGHDEVVYKYYADVRTATLDPYIYASQFAMRADLHIRNDKAGNGTIYFLKNIEVYAFNGEKKFHDDEVPHWTPLPKQSEEFLKPFYVGYDEFGLTQDIMFAKDEPEWTMNVKKAIASMIQLNWTKITKEAKTLPYAFHTHEHTIYGVCDVSYEVVPSETEYVVTKYFDPKHCDGHVEQVYTNIVPTQCHADHDDSYRTPTKKIFHIKKDGLLKEIDATSKILMYPFKQQDNLQVVYVNQTLHYVKDVKPQEAIDVSSFVVYYPLTFTKPHIDEHTFVPDYTFGKEKVDAEAYVPRVKEMFYEAAEYLQDIHIDNSVPDTKKGLVINRIVGLLKYFDVAQYEKVLEVFQQGTTPKDLLALEMFYKILPNVGTRPCAIFIKNLIAGHKVKDYIASAMLYTLGVNMHVPSEKILVDLVDFIQWEDKVKPEVRNAAILTYATLVYETYKEHEKDEHVEKYIKIYYNKLKAATTYEEQLVWLQGLSNIRIGSVYELFKPIVMGEPVFKYNRHLRAHAIWNILHQFEDQHIEAFETLWPIVVDRTLNNELRVAALKGVMKTASISQLYYIFQYMQTVECPHLYHFFYTAVHAMAHSEIYCDLRANITSFAEQVEQYFQNEPVQLGTGVWIRDYVDEDYDYGFTVYGNTIANEKTNQINQVYMKFNTYISNHFYNNIAVHIKFEGIEYPIESFFSDFMSFSADTFKGHLLKKTDEDVHIEIVLTHHEQVVYVKHLDEETIKSFFTADFFKLVSMMKYQFTAIKYLIQGEVNVPTDIGFTAQFYTHVPLVFHAKSLIPIFKPEANEVTLKTQKNFRLWRHGTYGVNVYNPIASMTQGVRRVFTLDANIPINFQITVNYETKSVKVTSDKDVKDEYNIFGLKSHVSSQVLSIPRRGVDIMHETCKDCHQYTTVSHHDKHETELFDGHTRFNGKQYYFGTYDCDYTPHSVKSHGKETEPITFDFLHDFGHVTLKKFFVNTMNWFTKNAYIYPRGNCGLVFYSRPCPTHGDPRHFEMTMKFDREHIDHDHETVEEQEMHQVVVPYHKNVIKMTFTTKDEAGKPVTEWIGDAHFTHIHGYLFKNVDLHFSRKIKDSDDVLNWCLIGQKDYFHDKINGDYKFYYGYSHRHECVKDDFKIVVDYTAFKSEDQYKHDTHTSDVYTYKQCKPHYPWSFHNETTYDCMYAHTTARHYRYDISYQHVPQYWEKYFEHIWHFMKLSYQPTFEYEAEHYVGDHSAVVEVVYPLHYDEPIAHVEVNHAGHKYTFNDFPASDYWWFVQPESLEIPTYFRYAKYFNYYNVCSIYPEHPEQYLPHHHLAAYPTKEWQVYAADKKDNHTWAVYVQKHGKNELAAKFVLDEHWIEVKPVESETEMYHYTMDSQLMQYMTNQYDDPSMRNLRVKYFEDTLFIIVGDLGMIWTYDNWNVRVVTTDFHHDEYHYHGLCYHH